MSASGLDRRMGSQRLHEVERHTILASRKPNRVAIGLQVIYAGRGARLWRDAKSAGSSRSQPPRSLNLPLRLIPCLCPSVPYTLAAPSDCAIILVAPQKHFFLGHGRFYCASGRVAGRKAPQWAGWQEDSTMPCVCDTVCVTKD
jgi:hypothetical protein